MATESITWETNTDWTNAVATNNITIDNDTFKIDLNAGTSGYLTTDTKTFSESLKPDLSDLSYTLNNQTIEITVNGSPGTTDEETKNITLDGATSYALVWTNSHDTFEVRIDLSTSDSSTTPVFDRISLTGDNSIRTIGWSTNVDWINSQSTSGVVFEDTQNTDHSDENTVKRGYKISSPVPSNPYLYWPMHEDSAPTIYDFGGENRNGENDRATLGVSGPLDNTVHQFNERAAIRSGVKYPDNRYVHYTFDEVGSSTLTDVVRGDDGTDGGWSHSTNEAVGYRSGRFDANQGDYSEIPGGIFPPNQNWTINMWLYFNDPTYNEDGRYLDIRRDVEFIPNIGRSGSGYMSAWINGSDRSAYFQPNQGEWYHHIIEHDNSNSEIRFYINNNLEYTFGSSLNGDNGNYSMINSNSNNRDIRDHADMTMDDFIVYHRLLTNTEKQQLAGRKNDQF